jgi:branched-chain amino acid transport system substrate-binding protein
MRGLAAAVTSLLVLSACGGDGGQPSASAAAGESQAPAGETAQGVTDDSIKIGVHGPFSGTASIYGKAQHMAMALYQEQNANGGINGRQIEIVEADDACDATTMQGVIRKFAQQDEVFMIHGGSCSNAVIASKPLIEELQLPFLSVNAASGTISNPPLVNLFQPKPTADEIGAAVAAFADSTGLGTVGIVAQSDEWGQTSVEPAKEALPETSLEVVVDEQIDPEAGDTTPQVRRLLGEEPGVGIVFAYPAPMSVFLRDAHAQGLDIPFITGDGARPDEQFDRIGDRDAADNLFSAYTYTAPLDDPAFDKYRDLLTEYYPNDEFDGVALEGAISAELNIAILEAMGDELTWENWIATAERSEGYETEVGGPMQFLPFDADDPRTRRPGMQINFSALDPSTDDASIVVIQSWEDWEGLTASASR